MKPSAFRSLPCTPRCHPVILPATCAEALPAKSSSQAGSLRAATPPAPTIPLLKAGATVIIAHSRDCLIGKVERKLLSILSQMQIMTQLWKLCNVGTQCDDFD